MENAMPGWIGRASRVEAEHRLAHQPVGTFVLRESDELTQCMMKLLMRENGKKGESYLLTLVESPRKISDLWVIQTSQGWAVYKDNPNLCDRHYDFYPTLDALLQNTQKVACRALNRET